jgi:hypothetical protein
MRLSLCYSLPRRTSASRQVGTLPKTSNRAELKAQLIEAHAKIQAARLSEDVTTGVTLARLGAFEIQLIAISYMLPPSSGKYWIELFDHDRQLSIDSVGNCDLRDAVIAAEDFIARATRLSKNPHSWRRST